MVMMVGGVTANVTKTNDVHYLMILIKDLVRFFILTCPEMRQNSGLKIVDACFTRDHTYIPNSYKIASKHTKWAD